MRLDDDDDEDLLICDGLQRDQVRLDFRSAYSLLYWILGLR